MYSSIAFATIAAKPLCWYFSEVSTPISISLSLIADVKAHDATSLPDTIQNPLPFARNSFSSFQEKNGVILPLIFDSSFLSIALSVKFCDESAVLVCSMFLYS